MQSVKTSASLKQRTCKTTSRLSTKPSKLTNIAVKRSIHTTHPIKSLLKPHQHAQTITQSTLSSSSQHFTSSPSSLSQLHITPHTILSNTFTTSTSQLHPISFTSPLTKSQRSLSTSITPLRQYRQDRHLKLQFDTFQSPITSHLQKASFFTSVVNTIKATIAPASSTDSTNTQPHTDESQFRELLNIDTQTQYKHVQEVMVGFRTFLAKRSQGEDSPISSEDKALYVETWTPEQYQSIQMDPSSAHFFQVPQLVIPSQNSQKQHPQGVDRIPASLSPDDPRYQEMMDNNTQRYHDGELNAKYDQRRAQMLKDSLETDVYHVDPDKLHQDMLKVTELQNKYENNPAFAPPTSSTTPELKITQNPDGSYSFESSADAASKSKPGSDTNVTFTPKLDANGDKIKVPVTGESVAIGQINDPRMLISFICDMCDRRNVKSIPKRSYLRGVVLIRCECEADHLISDNLGWFDDSGQLTIEKIMEQDKGEKVFRASVLDLNKPIKTADQLAAELAAGGETGESGQKSHNVVKTGVASDQLSDTHISPELYAKIQDTIRIAREQDKTQSPQFQHFYHEDKLFEQISKQTVLPLLPPGKQHKVDPTKH